MSTDIVVAIDFGTTYSGYAYSLSTEPRNVIANRSWGTELAVRTPKAPTCVLTDEYDNFVAFGYKAVNILADNANDEKNYHFYDDIKMTLYKEKMISAKAEVEAVDGHRCQTITIVQMILSYLSKHAIKALQRNNPRLRPNSIRWVLTVPAIWNEAAKQFMRRAAFYADMINDMESERLMIALEPECASYWCQTLHDEVPDDQTKKYMVVDCGGGTIDITVHKKKPDGKIEESHRATGGDWGARLIEHGICQILKTIFGSDFIDKYRKENLWDWIQLVFVIESKKRGVSCFQENNIVIPLSHNFGKAAEEYVTRPFDDLVASINKPGVTFNNRRQTVSIGGTTLKTEFDKIVDKILDHVADLFSVKNVADTKSIYLVGGFGESEILRTRMEERFGRQCILLVPEEAAIAVMKGAVLFGHDPFIIESRIARRTYGEDIRTTFIHGVHDCLKKVINEDGEDVCEDIFRVWVKKGESVKTGEIRSFVSIPSHSSQKSASFDLYVTDKDNVLYITEDGVYRIGKMEIQIPDNHLSRADRIMKTSVRFGGTEIHAQVADGVRKHGDIDEATLSFLADDE